MSSALDQLSEDLGSAPADLDDIAGNRLSSTVGPRLRALREATGVTLTEVACAAGMSKAHLSRLESGDRSLSLANLLTLAGILRVPVASILPPEPGGDGDVLPSAGPVVRASDLRIRSLTRRADSALKPFHVVVPAERAWSAGATHAGEEWIYVLRGAVSVIHGDRTDTLHMGDSIHLEATEPHRLVAAVEAELIVVAQQSDPN